MTNNFAHSKTECDCFANRIEDIARRAGISRAQVYVLLGSGKLKARKISGRTIILESDFREFLDSLPSWQEVQRKVLPLAA